MLRLASLIRPGEFIACAEGTAEPRTLTEALVEQRFELEGVSVLLGISFTDTFKPEHADALKFRSFGAYGTNIRLAAAGVLDIIPCHLSAVPTLIASGAIPVDVALVQVSPKDSNGEHSLGVVSGYLLAAIRRARLVIAEVNEQMPQTYGDTKIPSAWLHQTIVTSRPLVESVSPDLSDVADVIGRNVAERIADGSTVQFGIGNMPEAVAVALLGKRELGVHSGMITDRVLDLIEAGVVTNERKKVSAGITTTGALFGTQRLFDFARNNRLIEIRSAQYTHAVNVLASLQDFVAVNSAIEVDLTGQVNAEVIEGRYVGAVGGAVDFMRGAAYAGRSIVALPSTAKGGRLSRIVDRLTGCVVSALRSDLDTVVTEFGAAEVKGCTARERAKRLARIAHPDFRAALLDSIE